MLQSPRRRKPASLIASGILFSGLAAATVFAGGFKIQDQSTRAMGMIDAFVAGAGDASAVYYNPAGLTRLSRPQWITNMYAAYGVTRYDGAGHTEHSDNRHYVLPTLFFAAPLPQAPDIALGIGIYSPFGLGSRWPDDSRVRYGSTLGEIALVNVNPTAAVKLSEKLSLGAGIDVFTSTVKLRHMIDYSAYGSGDGQAKLEADGRGWGYNFGLQYQWSEAVALGFTYRSPVHVGYDGDAQFDGVPTLLGPMSFSYSADAQIDYPAVVAGALSWQSTEKLRLEFAAEWTQWSTRDTQAISIHAPPQFQQSSPAIIDWKDSWVLMLGAEYVVNDSWTLRCGYGYNQTPAPASTADPSLPAGHTHALALGAGYRLSEHATLDIACVVAYSRRRELHGARAQMLQYAGDYDAFSTYFSLGFTWDF